MLNKHPQYSNQRKYNFSLLKRSSVSLFLQFTLVCEKCCLFQVKDNLHKAVSSIASEKALYREMTNIEELLKTAEEMEFEKPDLTAAADKLTELKNRFDPVSVDKKQVYYPMLRHLPGHGVNLFFRLYIFFYLPLLLLSFIRWKTLLNSPAFFQFIFHCFFVFKLLECIIIFTFLSLDFIQLHQVGFNPNQFTHYLIRFLSLSISQGFEKSKQSFWIILVTNSFSTAFNIIGHPVFLQKLIFGGFPPFFAPWNQTF